MSVPFGFSFTGDATESGIMEPNILATPGSSTASGIQRTPPAEGGPRSAEPKGQGSSPGNGTALAVAPPPTHVVNGSAVALSRGDSNGFVNGHLNGHANGHGGHMGAWPALATAPAYAPAVPLADFPVADEGLYLRFGKRILDVAGALIGLVLSAPLLLLAAILIKVESRGPVLYRSIRIGRGARPFMFYKLRSMMDGAERHRHTLTHLNETDGPVFKMSRDPRVTRVGAFLRTTSLDEIPQLINVLKGEMSLVGPRPPIAEEVVQYEPWQLRRLDVLPGITCLWQISGRSRIGFQEWMRLDLEYIKHRSFSLDLKILIRTIPAVLSREGAY